MPAVSHRLLLGYGMLHSSGVDGEVRPDFVDASEANHPRIITCEGRGARAILLGQALFLKLLTCTLQNGLGHRSKEQVSGSKVWMWIGPFGAGVIAAVPGLVLHNDIEAIAVWNLRLRLDRGLVA